jgi:uncharacterized membrane protein YqjE
MNENSYTEPRGARTLAAVIAELKDEIKEFGQTRVRIFLTELREDIQKFKGGAILTLAGVALLATAWLFLNLAVVGLIAAAFWGSPFAWFFAFLIVGGCWLIIGAALGFAGIKRFRGLAPKKTIAVLQKDKVWLQQEARNQI